MNDGDQRRGMALGGYKKSSLEGYRLEFDDGRGIPRMVIGELNNEGALPVWDTSGRATARVP